MNGCARRRWQAAFPFPVKYGYAAVGRVEAGELAGKTVFALHPHQCAFNVAAGAAVPLPEGVTPQRAVLAANMETALNAVWDAGAGPADRITVVGAGVVGALVSYLCGRLAGADVTLIDIDPSRAAVASALGVAFAQPPKAPRDCDVVFHTSGNAQGLASAIDLAGDEGDDRRNELVRLRHRRARARRRVSQPPAETDLEPGGTGRAVAAAALDAPAAASLPRCHCSPIPSSTRCSRPRSPSTTCRPNCRAS